MWLFFVWEMRAEPLRVVAGLSKTLGASLLKNVHADGVTPYRVGGAIYSIFHGSILHAFSQFQCELVSPHFTASSKTIWPLTSGEHVLSGGNGGMGCHTLAESGTNLLEFRYLSQVTTMFLRLYAPH